MNYWVVFGSYPFLFLPCALEALPLHPAAGTTSQMCLWRRHTQTLCTSVLPAVNSVSLPPTTLPPLSLFLFLSHIHTHMHTHTHTHTHLIPSSVRRSEQPAVTPPPPPQSSTLVPPPGPAALSARAFSPACQKEWKWRRQGGNGTSSHFEHTWPARKTCPLDPALSEASCLCSACSCLYVLFFL